MTLVLNRESREECKMQGKVIDADGHILEPPELWQTHLEAK